MKEEEKKVKIMKTIRVNVKAFAIIVLMLCVMVSTFAVGQKDAVAADETVILKLGHIDTPSSPMGLGAEKFKELVESRSNGKIRVDVFPSEQIGTGPAMVEDLIGGSLELYLENPGTFDQYVDAQKIHFVQYYFRSREHLRACTKSDLWKEVFTEPMEKIGVKTLGTKWNWDRGPIRVFVSTKPVRTPDDLDGIKLRLWSSDVAIRLWKYLGASPIVMSWNEVYLGLVTGTVDAVTASGATLWPNKFTEVAKYVTLLGQQIQTINLHMNKDLFDSLPADLQEILIDCANDAGAYFTDLVNNNWEKEKQLMIKEHGAEFLTVDPIDLKKWIEKAKTMLYVFEDEGLLPKGLYDKFQKIPDEL